MGTHVGIGVLEPTDYAACSPLDGGDDAPVDLARAVVSLGELLE